MPTGPHRTSISRLLRIVALVQGLILVVRYTYQFRFMRDVYAQVWRYPGFISFKEWGLVAYVHSDGAGDLL